MKKDLKSLAQLAGTVAGGLSLLFVVAVIVAGGVPWVAVCFGLWLFFIQGVGIYITYIVMRAEQTHPGTNNEIIVILILLGVASMFPPTVILAVSLCFHPPIRKAILGCINEFKS